MPPTTADELRRAFLDFFVERGHTRVESASLIPHDNFTKAKKQYAEAGGLRSNERNGWIRTRL